MNNRKKKKKKNTGKKTPSQVQTSRGASLGPNKTGVRGSHCDWWQDEQIFKNLPSPPPITFSDV